MSLARRAVLAAVALAAGGCGPATVSLREGPRSYTAVRYDEVLRRWTRHTQLFSLTNLDDLLTVDATYESWDFRWAYVVRYASDFRLSTAERTRLLETSLGAARREHEFFVALYTQNWRWGQLTRPTSAWRVLLLDDQQHEIAPTAIEPIRRPGALERTYFPYTTVWRQAYRIRFPRTARSPDGREIELLNPRTRFFTLRFSGPLGTADLTWYVET